MRSVTVSPDANQAIVLDPEEHHSHLDLTSGRQTRLPIDLKRVPAQKGGAFSRDGRRFAAPSLVGWLRLLDLTQPGCPELASFRAGDMSFHGVVFSPDDQRLVSGGDGRHAIVIWDVVTLEPLLVLPASGSAFRDQQVSPEGNTIGSTGGIGASGALTLWFAPSWAEIEAAEKSARAQ